MSVLRARKHSHAASCTSSQSRPNLLECCGIQYAIFNVCLLQEPLMLGLKAHKSNSGNLDKPAALQGFWSA